MLASFLVAMRVIACALRQLSQFVIDAREAARADERELRLLLDHRAQAGRILARGRAIEHDLCHRQLAFQGLALAFEIDRGGDAALLLVERVAGRIGVDQRTQGHRLPRLAAAIGTVAIAGICA